MTAEDANRDQDRMSFLEGYADKAIETLPMELQRNFALIRQLDESAQDLMDTVAEETQAISNQRTVLSVAERREKLAHIASLLNEALKRGEEKFALAKSTYDTVDRHCTKLDNDLQKFEDEQLIGPGRRPTVATSSAAVTAAATRPSAASTTASTSAMVTTRGRTMQQKEYDEGSQSKKKGRSRKRKVEDVDIDEEIQGEYLSPEDSRQHAQAAINLSNLPIDPNEPLYCYCQQVSFGEMVACDNEDCEIEWFHLECVGLRTPPKGKWYCKNCAAQLKGKQKR